MADNYTELFERAAELAGRVPESMQADAFNRALDLLLEQESSDTTTPQRRRQKARGGSSARRAKSKRGAAETEGRNDADALIEGIDRTAHPEVKSASGVQDRALWILKIAEDQSGIDRLSAPDIARVLKEKFKLRATPQGVRQALDRASDFVDRDTTTSVIKYRIMGPGEDHLANPSDEEPRKRRPRPKKGKSAERSTKSTGSGSRRSRNKAEASAPTKSPKGRGPMPALRALAEEGFFGEGRTISDMRAHLEEKQGRRFKATDLSPALVRLVRDKVLDRSKNADGQYEYFVK